MKKRQHKRVNATGRTEAGEQFIALSYPMLRSPAWRSLSGRAIKVWLELRSRYDGRNNGQLSLSQDEGARLLGIGKATVARSFAELEAKGFLVLTKRGVWFGRRASEYATTDRSMNGHPATQNWKQWQPKKQSLGSSLDHIGSLTGPPQHRSNGNGSITEPVRP